MVEGSAKIETDEVEFLAGVRHGSTLGSPISMAVWNRDWPNWQDIMDSDPFNGRTNSSTGKSSSTRTRRLSWWS